MTKDTIYILMKNGWPKSAFQFSWIADSNLGKAQESEPNEDWMILEIPCKEEEYP